MARSAAAMSGSAERCGLDVQAMPVLARMCIGTPATTSSGVIRVWMSWWHVFAGDLIAVDVAEDDEEFVAAQAAGDVSWSCAVAEQGSCVSEELVTDRVPEGVVHFLESVEVDEHDCGSCLG